MFSRSVDDNLNGDVGLNGDVEENDYDDGEDASR
jgi:hypothetical protein